MNLVDEVYAHFPWWVGWIQPFVYVPLGVAGSLMVSWFGSQIGLRPFRRFPVESWAERARLGVVARTIGWSNVWLCSGACALLFLGMSGDFSRVPILVWGLLGLFSGLAGAIVALSRTERLVRERHRPLLRQVADTGAYVVLLGFVPHIIFVVTAIALPSHFSFATCTALITVTGFVLFWSLGGHWLILNFSGLLCPASERAMKVTEEASKSVGLRPRKVVEIRMKHANAFAFPHQQAVGYTKGILEALDDDELTAICAHELGHLGDQRYRMLRWISISFHILCLPLVAIKPLIGTFGTSWVFPALLGFISISILFRLVALRIRRGGEVHADEIGSQDHAYARALEHIYRVNMIPVSQKSLLGHPALYDRLTAAGAPPDYPRPKPPPYGRLVLVMLAELGLCTVLLIGWMAVQVISYRAIESNVQARLVRMATVGGDARDIAELGNIYFAEGSHEKGIALLELASARQPESIWIPAHLAMRLAELGRCEEAYDALWVAEFHLERHVNPDAWIRETVDVARDAVIRWCGDYEKETAEPQERGSTNS